ncbi:RNA recognition motif. (a.k.a. RRM, RBD, or RNP domain) [Nitrosomonas sp. Nm51]|uniref:RNA recognition motif domain-containing protein n=1 Tax=Nitrosomonas sp. Nm51 TaxID=133720 RepID=UPI0008C9B1AF|nr:RNA-binding protein [Nitrosomonas sp. Nm51]SER34699.1 RNA recognition motif. (a.k.a. RRM, RBD, or RNP domain) [Nitrosomonas sp. Nm51]
MKRLFVGNLPSSATEASVIELFSECGKVHSIKLATDMFSGKCIGFGFISMEGHEARAAIEKLNGYSYGGKSLRIGFEDSSNKRGRRR